MIKTEQRKYFGSSLLVNKDYQGPLSVDGSTGGAGRKIRLRRIVREVTSCRHCKDVPIKMKNKR
jgi:hypothetical protein